MHRLDTSFAHLNAWQTHPHVIPRRDVVLRVAGPGAVACLQGLFTNDIEQAGAPSLSWGAMLTPKGMIITDLWIWRREADLLLVVPEAGIGAVLELLRKSIPPRLAKVTDARDAFAIWWTTSAAAALPEGVEGIQPQGPAPFACLAVAPPALAVEHFTNAGWQVAPAIAADVLALLGGWPMLGREIDARTLVQEVRFDELQGVRYDKGCFVGQETVSRLHFRGHPNRTLRAVVGRGVVPSGDAVRTGDDERDVGAVATLLTCGVHWIGSTRLRREVSDGDHVRVDGHDAAVRAFPIAVSELA